MSSNWMPLKFYMIKISLPEFEWSHLGNLE